jgi:hypothetical protein
MKRCENIWKKKNDMKQEKIIIQKVDLHFLSAGKVDIWRVPGNVKKSSQGTFAWDWS